MVTSTKAIVAYEPLISGAPNFEIETLALRELKENELLVKIVASGICHTDIVVGSMPAEDRACPMVIGHEGAGIVHRVGSKVSGAKPGDSVVLSFSFCESCRLCKTGHPAYCPNNFAINFGGERGVYMKQVGSGEHYTGLFFGQSSLSNFSIAKDTSVVNVTSLVKNEELKIFAPMGCGFMTGAATVTTLTNAGKEDSVCVMGLGAVGLAAIMAAKIQGCHTVIGIDRVKARLDLARELGATHVLDTSDKTVNIGDRVKALTEGIGSGIVIDTTGNTDLIKNGLDLTANLGQMVVLGIPPRDGIIEIHLLKYLEMGRSFVSSLFGDAVATDYIPRMIKWYKEGRFPIDKLIKHYSPSDFATAIEDTLAGRTIKPVTVWDHLTEHDSFKPKSLI